MQQVDQNGNKVSLADHKGKKVVLFFYPEDDTPTCTIEACNLRDNYAMLKKNGFVVLFWRKKEEGKVMSGSKENKVKRHTNSFNLHTHLKKKKKRKAVSLLFLFIAHFFI